GPLPVGRRLDDDGERDVQVAGRAPQHHGGVADVAADLHHDGRREADLLQPVRRLRVAAGAVDDEIGVDVPARTSVEEAGAAHAIASEEQPLDDDTAL